METISTIKVTLSEIMDNLKLLTSYFGGKREEDAASYDRVALLDSDAALVALLMEDAAMRIAALFPGRLTRWRYYRSALEFSVEGEPDNDGLHSALVKAVSQEVLRRWLRIGGSDYADALSAPGDELTDALKIYFPEEAEETAEGKKIASPRTLPPI